MLARGAARLGLAAAGASLIAISCASGDSGPSAAEPAPCLTPTPVDDDRLPDSLPLAQWGEVTEVAERGGFLGAKTISPTQIVELYPEVVRTLTEGGYVLLGGDNEGFEAEITFDDPKGRLTTFTMQEGPCEEVIVRVLVQLESRGAG